MWAPHSRDDEEFIDGLSSGVLKDFRNYMFTQSYIAANSQLFLDTSWISIPALKSFLEARASDPIMPVVPVVSARVKREPDASDASQVVALTVKSEPVTTSLLVRTRSQLEGGREVIELLSDSDDDDALSASAAGGMTDQSNRVRGSSPELNSAQSDLFSESGRSNGFYNGSSSGDLLPEEFRQQGEVSTPRSTSPSNSCAGTYSPHYEPTTPSERSPTPVPSPAAPSVQPGASVDAPLSPNTIEMQVDSQEGPSVDALATADTLKAPVSRCSPARSAARGRQTARLGAPPAQPAPTGNFDSRRRPIIALHSARKSVTPPAADAYNDGGEEEKEKEDEEETTRPSKRQRTSSGVPKSKSKNKAKAGMPVPSSSSPRFPPSVRKTRGKSKKDEAPLYAPPRPVPTMDTVLLASESVAKEQSEPTVFDAGCATCILRDRECEHGTPGTICDHCSKGRVSHCSHTFVVADHTRAANHLEPYTRLSNERSNELITDLATARADYELVREHLFRASTRLAIASNRVGAWIRQTVSSLGPHGLPMMAELPEELRPLWAQLLLDSEAELSVDYRDAIRRYPFISDSRRTDLTTDEDLPILVDFLLRRAARVQQLTPPPKESSGWPYRDEAGPSGSK